MWLQICVKPFGTKKQHDLRKLSILFDTYVRIYLNAFRTISTCALHHSSQSSRLPRHDCALRRGFINIAWSAHGLVRSLRLESGPCMAIHVSMLILPKRFLVGSFTQRTYPQLSDTFLLAFENILHKITQCLINYCRFASVVMTADTAWKSIVNYEDDYIKHHM